MLSSKCHSPRFWVTQSHSIKALLISTIRVTVSLNWDSEKLWYKANFGNCLQHKLMRPHDLHTPKSSVLCVAASYHRDKQACQAWHVPDEDWHLHELQC